MLVVADGEVAQETTMSKDYQDPKVPRLVPRADGLNRVSCRGSVSVPLPVSMSMSVPSL